MRYDDVLRLAEWPQLPVELEGLKNMVLAAERLCIPQALAILLNVRLSDLSPTQLQGEFKLPSTSVGLDQDGTALFLQDTLPGQVGLDGKRKFLECWPTIRSGLPDQQIQGPRSEPPSRLTGFAFMYGEIRAVRVFPKRPVEYELEAKGAIHWFGTWFPLEQKLDMIFGEGIPAEDKAKSIANVLGALKQLAYAQFHGTGTDSATI